MCLACYRRESLLYARSSEDRSSAFDAEAATEFVFELDQAAEGAQGDVVLLAVEGGQHARMVADGSD